MLKNSVSESWLTSRQRPVGYWGTGRSEDDGRLIVDLFSLHLPNLFASFSLFSRFPEVNVIVNCVCSNLSVKCRQTKTQNGLFSFVKTFVEKKKRNKKTTNQPTNQSGRRANGQIDRQRDRQNTSFSGTSCMIQHWEIFSAAEKKKPWWVIWSQSTGPWNRVKIKFGSRRVHWDRTNNLFPRLSFRTSG